MTQIARSLKKIGMSNLRSRIEAYCQRNDISIPTGFYRRSPSKFVVIRKTESGWALTARTWFNVADLLHYLDTYCSNVEYRFFNFAENTELKRRGSKQVEQLKNIE